MCAERKIGSDLPPWSHRNIRAVSRRGEDIEIGRQRFDPPGLAQPQLLGNLASIERRESPVIVNHYNVQPVFDVLANTQDRDVSSTWPSAEFASGRWI